jgi:hypothetical protein
MRKILGLVGALVLAACGNGNSEDFTVDVAMSPDRAKAELAQLDGGIALAALSLPKIERDGATQNELTFTLPGDSASGELLMRFEEVGTNGTRIHVAVDLPTKLATIEGKPMILSESAVEDMLKRRLTEWAQETNSGYASLDSLNEAMAGLSIAMKPGELEKVLGAADDPEKLAALLGPEFLTLMEAEGDDGEYLAAADDLDEPMLDPSRETWEASAPMDEADGSTADERGEGTSADWGSDAY